MLELTPISLKEANLFVAENHRHHKPVVGCKFAVAVSKNDVVVGVGIAGRPVSRHLDDGWTLEVTRCCTDGTRNAPSKIYGALSRAGFALGYRKVITYTMPEEGGTTMRAVGWRCLGLAGGGSWSTKSRPRVDKHPMQKKLRWELCK